MTLWSKLIRKKLKRSSPITLHDLFINSDVIKTRSFLLTGGLSRREFIDKKLSNSDPASEFLKSLLENSKMFIGDFTVFESHSLTNELDSLSFNLVKDYIFDHLDSEVLSNLKFYKELADGRSVDGYRYTALFVSNVATLYIINLKTSHQIIMLTDMLTKLVEDWSQNHLYKYYMEYQLEKLKNDI